MTENHRIHKFSFRSEGRRTWLGIDCKWLGTVMTVLSITTVLAGCHWRGLSLLQLISGFGITLWFTAIPGACILLLFGAGKWERLRFLLASFALGVVLIPMVYIPLQLLGGWHLYGIAQSVLNLLLVGCVLYKRAHIDIPRLLFSRRIPAWAGILLLLTVSVVLLREMTQLVPPELRITSTQEVDTGFLMGLVASLKHTGQVLNYYDAAAPMSYHYFTYLLMATIGKYSAVDSLSLFQVIFPLIVFPFLSFSAGAVARRRSSNSLVPLLAGALILFLDDFSILNQVIAAITRGETSNFFYTTQTVAELHMSPSWALSIALVFVLLVEIDHIKQGRLWEWWLVIISASILCGYKVPAWSMLVAGFGLVSLLQLRRNKSIVAAAVLIGVLGALIFLTTVGAESALSTAGSPLVGYPVLRNDAVRTFLVEDHTLSFSDLDLRTSFIVIGLVPVWLLVILGVRLVWIVGAAQRLQTLVAERDLMQLTVLFSVLAGLAVPLIAAPEKDPIFAYYWVIFALVVSTPFTAVAIIDRVSRHRYVVTTLLLALVVLQSASGILYVIKPAATGKTIATLPGAWFDVMTFLRENTRPTDRLLSNRYDLTTVEMNSAYAERFYFVAGLAERPLVSSGRQYSVLMSADFELRRAQSDSLLATQDVAEARALAHMLLVDYIVIDKWQGASLPSADPSFVNVVYDNPAATVYQVIRDDGK